MTAPLGRLGSAGRRLWRRLAGRRIDWVYSRSYRLALGGTSVDPLRGERILTFLLHHDLVNARRLLRPEPASFEMLRRVHTDDYLERLQRRGALLPIVGFDVDDDVQEMALDSQRAAVGGTVRATRQALRHRRPAVNLGGGFHHARPEAGMGFCIFNDVAVAIAAARADGFDGRVLVIDLDLHDGNGTRAAFAEDESVFTFSIHNRPWDDDEAVASLSVELEGAVGDELYLETLREHLPPILESTRPRLVYFLAGTDLTADDRLGNWQLSGAGMLARDRFVIERLRRIGTLPLVILLAGGYGNRTWRYSARSFGWLASGRDDLEPPSTESITLIRYRRLVEFFDTGTLSSDAPPGDDELFELSEEDLYGGGGLVSQHTRLLGYYSRHGLELLLESCGLLDQLRRRGFPSPTLDLDLDNPAGETFRIYGDSSRRELLMEARLGLDKRTLEGFELMRLEWLLLQNPRVGFAGRLPLPGQKHPGLGLLNDVMAILVLLCERRKLDGILFVPSHYHLAAKGKKYLRFVDPADEAWFRAVRDAVEDFPLRTATLEVAAGRVVDRTTGERVPWRPMHMVLPLSDKLIERVTGDDYEEAVVRERERYRFQAA